jgi:formylmethanofuran dehydrogenase subunit C
VEGNVGYGTAYGAKSGSVTVKGNARDATGRGLEGASVTVEGNTGKNTAADAKSGIIHVRGEISGLGGNIGEKVKIAEAGKQVWPGRWNWIKWMLGLRKHLPDYT